MEMVYNNELKDYICYAKKPLWRVKSVVPRNDYTMLITFESGEKKLFDASALLTKAIYSPLKNLSFFMGAKVEGDTIIWSEDIDIAPEHLYANSKLIEQ